MSEQENAAPANGAAQKATPPRNAPGGTVTVGCKLPSGFVMETHRFEPIFEPVLGGGTRETRRAFKTGREHTLNGYAINPLEAMKGNVPTHLIIGGYGLTSGVPRDFWDEWYAEYKDSALVKNQVIVMHETADGARAMVVDRAKVQSGFEPIDPENPGAKNPEFRRIQRGTRTETSDADNL
jgi:hypothetical protein